MLPQYPYVLWGKLMILSWWPASYHDRFAVFAGKSDQAGYFIDI